MPDELTLPLLPLDGEDDSVNELQRAATLYHSLGMPETKNAVERMAGLVRDGRAIDWPAFATYLEQCENEASATGVSTRDAFQMLEKLLIEAASADGVATRRRIISLAEASPSVSRHVEPLEFTLRHIVEEARAAKRPWTYALLLMLAHVIRFDALDRLVRSTVKHYGGRLPPELQANATTILLTLAFAKPLKDGVPLRSDATQPEIDSAVLWPDSRLIRDAIAHGSFTLDTSANPPTVVLSHIGGPPIWESPLPIADLEGLNDMLERRLRMLEATLRALRGWGRHASER